MKQLSWYLTTLIATLALACVPISSAMAQTDAPSPVVTYDDVRPVFKKHCVSCHGAQRSRGDLNLSTTAGIQAGSTSGVVAVSGKPEESLLYTLAAHLDTPKMPPGAAKIPQRELDLIRKWIEDGMQQRMETPAAAAEAKAPTGTKPAVKMAAVPATKSIPLIEPVQPLSRRTAITALAVSPKDAQVAVSGQRQVVLLSGTDRTSSKAFPFPEGDVHALRFSRDGDWLLAGGGIGGESGKVVAFDSSTGKRVFEVGAEPDVVLAFDLSPDRKFIALGGPGKNVKVYRVDKGELVTTLGKHTDWILSVAFSPDGLLLATGDRFGGLQIWEAGTGKPFHTLRGHVGPVNTLAWSADSDRLLSGGQDETLRSWDLHQGTQLQQWDAEVGGVLAAAWTPTNQIIAGGRNRKVVMFDLMGQRQREWSVADEVVELAATADGRRLVVGDALGGLSTWTTGSGIQEAELTLPLAPTTTQVVVQVPARKQRSKSVTFTKTAQTQESLLDAKAELAATLEALANAEAAVKSAEESLEKLRASAKQLKRLAAIREAAAKQAAPRTKSP